MARPIFGNRENQRIEHQGREIWLARSVAVVASVVATVGGRRHVALLERGPALPDEVGKLALPGGYLDWNETTFDAARREVFEEVGLDVAEWVTTRAPWRIHDAPIGKQNVTMHHYFARELEALPALTHEHAGPGEITRTLWMPYEDAMALEMAFGHQHVLAALLERLGSSRDP
ncbi:MAG TPA: NUDIX hydrolase [Myxococcales bacterium]|jgi:8-oxo-dGTP pyrophosphatase MutT (NUDIX family)